MARPRKGKPLTLRPIRIDDDVWQELQRLREKHGTINEGLRARLFATRSEAITVPFVPGPVNIQVIDARGRAVEASKPAQPWRKASAPLLKPGQRRK